MFLINIKFWFDRIIDIGKVRSKKIKTYPPYLKLGCCKNHSKNNIKIPKYRNLNFKIS